MTLIRRISFLLQKYENLFEQNAKKGSFYLQPKVHRAKECLEEVYKPKEPETKKGKLDTSQTTRHSPTIW